MNAVMLTVKATYVAYSKYTQLQDKAPKMREMRAPQKKFLFWHAKPQKATQNIHKESWKKKMAPIQELANFQQTFEMTIQ